MPTVPPIHRQDAAPLAAAFFALASLLALVGCGGAPAPAAEEEQARPVAQQPAPAAKPAPAASAKPASDVPNLWTRQTGVDWPKFLGPNEDSKSPETGILTKWPAAGPKIVWQRELGTSYDMPTISRGRLFQFDRTGDTARAVCLNAETGEELWHFEYPTDYSDLYGYNNGPRCSPVVDGDRVYTYGAEGKLHCLRATDGKLLWKVDTQKDFGVVQNFFGVGSTPVVEGNLLIVMVGGSPPESQQVAPGLLDRIEGNGSGIVAFDKLTGEVKYKITDELASYASLKLATIDGRRWCFAFCRGGLVGFEPANGKVDFEYPWRAPILESVNASMPVVVDNQVFISETYGPGSSLLEVSPGKYKLVWKDDARKREKAMQTHWNTPVYVDGYLYGCSGRHTENAELRCIEWKTGKVMWSEPALTRTSLLNVDGHFLCLGEYGTLQLLKVNPEKYEPIAEVELKQPPLAPLGGEAKPLLNYPCWAAPILSHGLLYVRGEDRLICLELIPQKPAPSR
jgi:outer membrane protein assembly factor BamB